MAKEIEYRGWHIVSNGFKNWTAYAPSRANGPGQMSGSLGQLKKRIDGFVKDVNLKDFKEVSCVK